eukprot:5183880-Pleurochrysis_carterae.AAC.2
MPLPGCGLGNKGRFVTKADFYEVSHGADFPMCEEPANALSPYTLGGMVAVVAVSSGHLPMPRRDRLSVRGSPKKRTRT